MMDTSGSIIVMQMATLHENTVATRKVSYYVLNHYQMTLEVKTIRQGDPDFHFTDGMVTYPRAMLHVLPDCPHSIAAAISIATNKGWLKCVAHVPGKQITWEKLTND
jgi:hypothetical protein